MLPLGLGSVHYAQSVQDDGRAGPPKCVLTIGYGKPRVGEMVEVLLCQVGGWQRTEAETRGGTVDVAGFWIWVGEAAARLREQEAFVEKQG